MGVRQQYSTRRRGGFLCPFPPFPCKVIITHPALPTRPHATFQNLNSFCSTNPAFQSLTTPSFLITPPPPYPLYPYPPPPPNLPLLTNFRFGPATPTPPHPPRPQPTPSFPDQFQPTGKLGRNRVGPDGRPDKALLSILASQTSLVRPGLERLRKSRDGG